MGNSLSGKHRRASERASECRLPSNLASPRNCRRLFMPLQGGNSHEESSPPPNFFLVSNLLLPLPLFRFIPLPLQPRPFFLILLSPYSLIGFLGSRPGVPTMFYRYSFCLLFAFFLSLFLCLYLRIRCLSFIIVYLSYSQSIRPFISPSTFHFSIHVCLSMHLSVCLSSVLPGRWESLKRQLNSIPNQLEGFVFLKVFFKQKYSPL